MKKLIFSTTILLFLFNFSHSQTSKDFLEKNVRLNYSSINQELIIKTYFNVEHSFYIEVYNITGKFVKRFNIKTDTKVLSNQLFLKQGIYIFKIFDKNSYCTKRIIIK